jgi:hypothetical protein
VTTPAKVPKDIDMLKAITWRRVIADEAHQLTANCFPGAPPPNGDMDKKQLAAEKEQQLMKMLAEIPVTEGHWCLTGTPIRNYKQVSSMDRIFRFLSVGIKTSDLRNSSFVQLLGNVAIRYSKTGTIQVWRLRSCSSRGVAVLQRLRLQLPVCACLDGERMPARQEHAVCARTWPSGMLGTCSGMWHSDSSTTLTPRCLCAFATVCALDAPSCHATVCRATSA